MKSIRTDRGGQHPEDDCATKSRGSQMIIVHTGVDYGDDGGFVVLSKEVLLCVGMSDVGLCAVSTIVLLVSPDSIGK